MLLRSGMKVRDGVERGQRAEGAEGTEEAEGAGDATSPTKVTTKREEATHFTSNNGTQNTSNNSKPHNVYVVATMKVVFFTLIIMYFVAPVVLRLNPWIIKEAVFLNRVSWPPSLNLTDPAQLGMNRTISLWIPSEENLIGAWHTLPSEVEVTTNNTEFFAQSLSDGSSVVLYLHGNAGTRAGWHRMQIYHMLSAAGFHAISIDYRGFGDSAGFPSEDGLCADAMAAFKWIQKYSGGSPVYLWGHSLGSGVATKVARKISIEGLPLSGVVLEAPFNNLKSVVAVYPLAKPFFLMPWFSWVFLEALNTNEIYFASDEHIGAVSAPVLILHAEDDGIVPISLGRKLYETAVADKAVGGVYLETFAAVHQYGHKHIHKSPELPDIFRKFHLSKK